MALEEEAAEGGISTNYRGKRQATGEKGSVCALASA